MNKFFIVLILISIFLFIITRNIYYGIILIGGYGIIKIIFNIFSPRI